MAILFTNKDEMGHLQFWGKTTIAVNASKVIFFEGYPGALSIHINGTGTAAFMASVSVYPSDMIEAETAVFLDAEAADIEADQDFNLDFGTSGVKVTNRATSTDTLEVAWRIRKL